MVQSWLMELPLTSIPETSRNRSDGSSDLYAARGQSLTSCSIGLRDTTLMKLNECSGATDIATTQQ
jgi:hypothetical protein